MSLHQNYLGLHTSFSLSKHIRQVVGLQLFFTSSHLKFNHGSLASPTLTQASEVTIIFFPQTYLKLHYLSISFIFTFCLHHTLHFISNFIGDNDSIGTSRYNPNPFQSNNQMDGGGLSIGLEVFGLNCPMFTINYTCLYNAYMMIFIQTSSHIKLKCVVITNVSNKILR